MAQETRLQTAFHQRGKSLLDEGDIPVEDHKKQVMHVEALALEELLEHAQVCSPCRVRLYDALSYLDRPHRTDASHMGNCNRCGDRHLCPQ